MAMRDYLIGLAATIIIGLYATYFFAPDFFHHWVDLLLFSG
jgi:hypothetical protein